MQGRRVAACRRVKRAWRLVARGPSKAPRARAGLRKTSAGVSGRSSFTFLDQTRYSRTIGRLGPAVQIENSNPSLLRSSVRNLDDAVFRRQQRGIGIANHQADHVVSGL